MSEFIKTLNCKICKKKGISIFTKSYTLELKFSTNEKDYLINGSVCGL